jgi:hypothetical protein
MQEMIRKLNLLSYNKRDLIQTTWSGDQAEIDSDEEFMRIILNNPNKEEKEESSDDEERPQLNFTTNSKSSTNKHYEL